MSAETPTEVINIAPHSAKTVHLKSSDMRIPQRNLTTPFEFKKVDLRPVNDYAKKVSALRKDAGISLAQQLLGEDYEKTLSSGIHTYQKAYQEKVRAYLASLPAKEHEASAAANNGTFFRNAYRRLLEDIQNGKRAAAENLDDPDKAVTLEALLGKDGMALCLLANEEEVHSLDYRVAVFDQAVSGYSGKPWEKLLSLILSGPSGSGKSRFAKLIIEYLKGSDTKPVEDNSATNFIILVDGEFGRGEDTENPHGCSSVLADTIALAKARGFGNGVADLHERTKKYTESAKRVLRAAAFKATELKTAGNLMPETFTDYFFSGHIRDAVKRFLGLSSRTDVQPVFVNIQANQEAVRHDAEARAKKQSKAYNTNGFKLSEFCSSVVKKLLMTNTSTRAPITFVTCTNDRILVRPAYGTWVRARYGDPGAMPVSKRTFDAWLLERARRLAANQRSLLAKQEPLPAFQDLPEYADANQPEALLRFENGFAGARQQLQRFLQRLTADAARENNAQKSPAALAQNQAKIKYFENVLKVASLDIRKDAIPDAIQTIANKAKSIEVNGKAIHATLIFTPREREAISDVMVALANLSPTPVSIPSLSGTNIHKPLPPADSAISNIMDHLDRYIKHKRENTGLFSSISLFGFSGDEKLDVAKKIVHHLRLRLTDSALPPLALSTRQAAAARDGWLGSLVAPLWTEKKLIIQASKTTDDIVSKQRNSASSSTIFTEDERRPRVRSNSCSNMSDSVIPHIDIVGLTGFKH